LIPREVDAAVKSPMNEQFGTQRNLLGAPDG